MIKIRLLKLLKRNKYFPNIGEIMRLFKIKNIKMPLPYFAQIEPTTKCNFNCLTCTRKTLNSSRLNRDLTLDEFKLIITKIPSLKKIKLQGMGEPFLNSNLKEILEFGIGKGISFETISNGSVLKSNIHLISYFDYLFVSFDSSTKDNFEKIRQGSKFDSIINNLKIISDFKYKNKLNTKIGLNIVITHLNYQEIPGIIKIALFLKLDSVLFVEVENWLTPPEKEFLKSREFIKQARKYTQEIKEIIKKEKIKYPFFRIGLKNGKKRRTFCGWPFYKTFITVDGFITPCEIRMNPEIFNFGNIYHEDFKKIWNGEKYQTFRKSLIKNIPNQICDFCPD